MIVSIKGTLVNKKPSEIIIEVNGLGYLCHISSNTYNSLPNLNEEVSLLTYFQITENNQALFAFTNEIEKELFIMLISVSGIGPKTAIVLLSAVSPDEFKRRLIAGEVSMMTSLPGIGPKTARRIIVELKDKFVKILPDDLPHEVSKISDSASDALDALRALGYQQNDMISIVNKILQSDNDISTEDLIKKTLNKLR